MTWAFAGTIVGLAGVIATAIVSLVKSGRQHEIRPECAECHKKLSDDMSNAWKSVSRIDSRVSSLETSNISILKALERLENKIDGVLVALARRQEE
jgi:hypothetical protein